MKKGKLLEAINIKRLKASYKELCLQHSTPPMSEAAIIDYIKSTDAKIERELAKAMREFGDDASEFSPHNFRCFVSASFAAHSMMLSFLDDETTEKGFYAILLGLSTLRNNIITHSAFVYTKMQRIRDCLKLNDANVIPILCPEGFSNIKDGTAYNPFYYIFVYEYQKDKRTTLMTLVNDLHINTGIYVEDLDNVQLN